MLNVVNVYVGCENSCDFSDCLRIKDIGILSFSCAYGDAIMFSFTSSAASLRIVQSNRGSNPVFSL